MTRHRLATRLFVACVALASSDTPLASAQAVDNSWRDAGQVVLVTTSDWDANQGTLQTFERASGEWKRVHGAAPVAIGRSGSAWGVGMHPQQPGPIKKEGDGRSPAGVFRIGLAFGYAKSIAAALPYQAMTASDYCIDVNDSPLYNRIVDARIVGERAIEGSTEPMRRDIHADGDVRYKLGFVIEHNAAATPGAGSCIFAHLWRSAGEPTSGCTAMEYSIMHALLGWLRQDLSPVFVLLPQQQYERVRSEWKLP